MLDMDLHTISRTASIIHQLTADAVITKRNGVVVIVKNKLVLAIAAGGNVEISFFIFHTNKCGIMGR